MHYDIRNFNGQLCLNFSKVLSSIAINANSRSVRVLLFDERYTTKEAKMRLKHDKSLKGSLDAISAMCLLERYIEDQADGAIEALPCAFPIAPDVSFFDYNIVRSYIQDLHWSNGIVSATKGITGKGGRLKQPTFSASGGINSLNTENINDPSFGAIYSNDVDDNIDDCQNNNSEDVSNVRPLTNEEMEEIVRARRRKKGTLKSLHNNALHGNKKNL